MNNTIEKNIKELYKKQSILLKPIIYIGKYGISKNVLYEINKQLKNKKLIKIKVLKKEKVDIKKIALDLELICKANLINLIGHTIVLYKK